LDIKNRETHEKERIYWFLNDLEDELLPSCLQCYCSLLAASIGYSLDAFTLLMVSFALSILSNGSFMLHTNTNGVMRLIPLMLSFIPCWYYEITSYDGIIHSIKKQRNLNKRG
jgi:hypothetical protein